MFDEEETNEAEFNILSINHFVSKLFICLMKKRKENCHFIILTFRQSKLTIHYWLGQMRI